jgi:hypothetical protein
MGGFDSRYSAFDRFQQRHRSIGFPTTVLGFILQNHPHLEQRILDSALGLFPVIGPQLSHGSLHGSTLALIFGLAAAPWADMAYSSFRRTPMNHL